MIGSFKLPVPPAGAQDGREVELSVDGGYVVWRYVGDAAWINLFPVPQDGDDGQTAEFQFTGTVFQWRYVGAPAWTDLFDFSALAGNDGDDGREVELRENAGYVQWRYVGDVNWVNLYQIPTGGGTDNAFDVYLDFLDTTAFTYNCPAALKFTQVISEGTAPALSVALNTNMAQFQKLTVTPAVAGLVILKGELL